MMTWQGGVVLCTVAAILMALVREWMAAEIAFVAGLMVLVAVRILTPQQALGGFSNEGMITVAALFVVAEALIRTGALTRLSDPVLGRNRRLRFSVARMSVPVAGMSAFMNNTPLVAMFLPILSDWCRRNRVAASKMLVPLAYAASLGGMCTLIGTSTNLVVSGLLQADGMPPLGMFEQSWVGVPCCIVGLLYLIWAGPRLLPNRKDALEQLGEARREYIVEMLVQSDCPLAGRPIEEAGLRHLPGLFLIEIDRNGHIIAPVGPQERIEAGDRLVFAGVVSTIVDLQKIKGLVPATDSHYVVDGPVRGERCLCEAVVSNSSPLVGQSIRGANFRTVYNAAVVAVHRNGERVPGKLGDIVLRAGDTLLLETGLSFSRAWRNSPDFFLVSHLDDSSRPRYGRAPLALGILGTMVAVVALEWLPTVTAAGLAAILMVATGCLTPAEARRSLEWSVLIVIAASFGIAKAIEQTGVAKILAEGLLTPVQTFGPMGALLAVLVVTVVLTELLTNNAAAALIFPIAVATARQLGVDPRPFAICVAVGASIGFATPIGYQTNLMVYGPGGYRFTDYVKFGVPLDLLMIAVAVVAIMATWRS